MTPEDRFARIEHVTAALVEERRKDREEYRQLWRDTQRQIAETNATVAALALKIADTQDAIVATQDSIAATQDTIRGEAQRAAAAEQELRERIQALVSAIGEVLARQK